MRNVIVIALFTILSLATMAQVTMYNQGACITVLGGSGVYIKGEFYNDDSLNTLTANGDVGFINAGEVSFSKNVVNHAPNGLFVTDVGTAILDGDSLQQLISDEVLTFHTLKVDKASNEVLLQQDIDVTDTLLLTSGNIELNNHTIDLVGSGNLVGENDGNRIYGDLGFVRTQRVLTSPSAVDDIAGIGLSIDAIGVFFGSTEILRGHQSQKGASNGSILRYYKFTPTLNGTANTVKIHYMDTTEMNDLNEASFSIWASDNDGVVWHNQQGVVNQSTDEVAAGPVELKTTVLTIAETDCDTVPQVSLATADTIYLCTTDTIVLDAENPGMFYEWSTAETTQKIQVAAEAIYHVRVTNANGCVGFDTVTVLEKPYPVVDFNRTFECQGDTSYFVNTSTIAADTMTYFWDFGDLNIESDTSVETNPAYVFDTTGLYTVTLIGLSDFECADTVSKSYIVHPNPIADFTKLDVCQDSIVSFSNASVIETGAMTYLWDFGVAALADDTSDLEDPQYVYAATNSYTVRLIATSNANCKDTIDKIVEIYPQPSVDFDLVNACADSTIQLSNASVISSGSVDFSWSFGDGTSSNDSVIVKSYDDFGDYTVTLRVISDYGCTDSLSQNVSVHSNPVPAFNTVAGCLNDAVLFTNSSSNLDGVNTSFEWQFGDGSVSNVTAPSKLYSAAGDYSVILTTSSDSGCTSSIAQSIEVFPVPTASFSATPQCEGTATSFINNSTISSGSISYSWNFGDGGTSTFVSPNHTYITSGNYSVQLIASTSKSCVDTVIQTVESYGKPVVDFGDTITTCGASIFLDAENAGSTFLWSDNTTDQTNTITQSGLWSVKVTDVRGCSRSEKVLVSLNSLFEPSLGGNASACASLELDAGNPGGSYVWSTGSTDRRIVVTTGGEYSVEITDQNDCVGYDTVQVVINDFPIVELGDDTSICAGASMTLDAQNSGADYTWSTNAETQTIDVTISGNYSVLVESPEGCTSSDAISVSIDALPDVSLGDDQQICDSTTLEAGVAGDAFLWSTGDMSEDLFVSQAGLYWLQVTSDAGCVGRDSIEITLGQSPIVELGNDTSLCNGDQITLDAGTNGISYLWSNGASAQTLEAASSGTYWVRVTNADGCRTYDSLTVSIFDVVTLDLGEDVVACGGGEVHLKAGIDNGTYLWQSNNGFSATSQSVTVSDSGRYWVEVHNENGCFAVDTISLQQSAAIVDASFLVVSLADVGDTIEFINLSTPTDADFYWDFSDGVTSTEESPLHAFFIDGSPEVTLIVSNEFCSDTLKKTLTISPLKQPEEEDEVSLFVEILSAALYPNPNYGEFKVNVEISTETTVILEIYDMTGRPVSQRTETGDRIELDYDQRTLRSGEYILRVTAGGEVEYLRFVKLD